MRLQEKKEGKLFVQSKRFRFNCSFGPEVMCNLVGVVSSTVGVLASMLAISGGTGEQGISLSISPVLLSFYSFTCLVAQLLNLRKLSVPPTPRERMYIYIPS